MRNITLLVAAAALPLGACATAPSDHTLASAGTGAAIGAAGGAGVAANAGGKIQKGGAIGAAIGGLALSLINN
jgi:osmotically inducible lipoprotein OsmB